MSQVKRRFTNPSVIRNLFIVLLIAIFTFSATLFAQNVVTRKAPKPSATAPAKPAKSAATASLQALDSSGPVTGIPWAGEAGVQETVAQIMTRASLEKAEPQEDEETEEEVIRPDRSQLLSNPESPKVAQFPALNKATLVEPHNPQLPGTSFTGATLNGTNPTTSFPPDTMGAAGPTQFIVVVNGRIVTFNKTTGAADGVINTSTDIFFNSVRNNSGTSDPRIRFDRLSNRWFILMINVSVPNRVLLAVSDTATITGSSVWTFFFFQQDQAPPTGEATCKADYPTLGIDANALYVGVNQFCDASLTYRGTSAFVIRKSSVIGAGPIVVTAFRNLTGTTSGTGLYTPQGVDNYDPAATEGYFIGVDNASFGTLVIRQISTPGATPSLAANMLLTVPATATPITVRHQGNTGGTNGQLDGLDDRLLAAHIRNGSLWTAHNIGVDNTGTTASTHTRNGARWYEIANLSTTPTLVQSGTLFASSASNTFDDRNYWIPSVMVSGQGHMALGSSIAGTSEFANAATAGRLASDPLGTLQAPTVLTSSSTAYNPPGDPGTRGARRWGDYSYTSLDPCDDMTMWTIQEFCDATDSYGVRVVKLLAPPPATPVSVNPPSVVGGQVSVNITVTGSQVAGSAFFDPGAGFGCHIGASITGGVTVNSVTYQNPTTVVLNISTTSATDGAKDLTITNPDGQTKTGLGLLTITGGLICNYNVAPTSQSFSGVGGTGSATVTVNPGCGWTAVSNDSWITITSGASGTGNGTVNYSVQANRTGLPRTGTMTIAGQTFTVNQSFACSYTITPTSQLFGYPGGTGNLAVNTLSGCAWTAVSNDGWITITSGASGNGNGTVNFTVAPRTSISQRTGTITVAENTFTITQLGATCVTGIAPASAAFPAAGGADVVNVTFPVSCSFTATTTDSWITPVVSGKKVNYTVAANSGSSSRTGRIAIGGLVFTVTQAANAATGDSLGAYDAATRTFYLRNSNTAGTADATIQYGPPASLPVVGDWNGDGTTTIGVYDPASRTFYLRNSNTAGFADITIPYGPPGALPLAGDWNGDGTTTIGAYDPASRTFYLRNSNTPGFADITITYGPNGALPIVGDWNGDGTTTIGAYDPATLTFYLRNSNTPGFADVTITYGPAGAKPVVGDWNGDGTTTIGAYDPASRTFYLRNSNTAGFADLTIQYGPQGATPLSGNWDGL
jgi:hypothetical protein